MSELRRPNINSVTISGGLTKNCELKYAQSGTAVAKLSLGYSKNFKRNGEWENKSCYLNVTCFGDLAERVAELTKGDPVIIQGSLDFNQWVDKENNKHNDTVLIANKIDCLVKKNVDPNGATDDPPTDDDVIF